MGPDLAHDGHLINVKSSLFSSRLSLSLSLFGEKPVKARQPPDPSAEEVEGAAQARALKGW